MLRFFMWCKERYICLLGFHGFNNKNDAEVQRCSFCGCHFEGWIAAAENQGKQASHSTNSHHTLPTESRKIFSA